MQTIPTTSVAYFIAAIATFVVGVRSTQNYNKFHSVLSRHFAISGFLASVGLFLYSVPFVFTNNPEVLKFFVVLGRMALDAVAIWQIFLIWYLTGLKKYKLRYFVWPLVLIGVIGYFAQVMFIINNNFSSSIGQTYYSFAPLAVYIHALSLSIVFIAGLILAHQSALQQELRAKVRLLSIAILYIFASAADMYNTVVLNGSNSSPIVLIGFLIAGGVFLITTILFSKKPRSR